VFHHALDGAAFTGSVTAFKQDGNALTRFFYPALHFEHLDLQILLERLVFITIHFFFIGIIGIRKDLPLSEFFHDFGFGQALVFATFSDMRHAKIGVFAHSVSPSLRI